MVRIKSNYNVKQRVIASAADSPVIKGEGGTIIEQPYMSAILVKLSKLTEREKNREIPVE